MNIHSVRVEMFHADRQTGILKPTVTFCNFVNVPKNISKSYTEQHACFILPVNAQKWNTKMLPTLLIKSTTGHVI
jgi:hypothetical protein